ncbi:MAG TPA: FAD-dependent oxidoreductase, partial [Flavobacterium sp.]|nr:FAD-dependent oxidoreductase [Flavobacterium sp.]
MQTPQKIAVVGSGLVGTLLAIYLTKKGHEVHVFDRSPDIRTVEFSGRSINLVMSDRGWRALKDVGLDDEIRSIGIPVDKRAIHLKDGKLNYQFYGKEGEAIFSLSRGVLNRKMIDLAEAAGVRITHVFESHIHNDYVTGGYELAREVGAQYLLNADDPVAF